ncbi:hypothetical protein AAE478_008723 [Parahypoxylon ruwenzoriense]
MKALVLRPRDLSSTLALLRPKSYDRGPHRRVPAGRHDRSRVLWVPGVEGWGKSGFEPIPIWLMHGGLAREDSSGWLRAASNRTEEYMRPISMEKPGLFTYGILRVRPY